MTRRDLGQLTIFSMLFEESGEYAHGEVMHRMNLVAALTDERVIGRRGGGLPWAVQEEYDHYLSLVRGNIVIMGRVSWEIFGRDLGESDCIGLSRRFRTLPGCTVAASLSHALALVGEDPRVVFCAGGASVYEQMLPMVDTLSLSFMKRRYAGDVVFPCVDWSEFALERQEEYSEFVFRVFRRTYGFLALR